MKREPLPELLDRSVAEVHRHRLRSRIGLLLAVVLIPFLLAVTACLKAPIGDPEKSKVDPLLTGAWLEKKTGSTEETLWVFQPFDHRAYRVGAFRLKDSTAPQTPGVQAEKADDPHFAFYKGWLTTIGGKRFLCLEPSFHLTTKDGMKPEYWFAFLLPDSLAGDSLTLRMVKGDKAGETTREIEEYIRRNLGNKELLEEEGQTLRRADRKQYDDLAKRLSAAGYQTD